MDLKAGDVVILKSGGQAMTVAEARADEVVCVWMGEEGDLFRESLPLAVLEAIEVDDEDEDDAEDDAKDTEANKVT
ncbi:YodC family protein [Rhodopseudomonas sp. NSM]|uniref:YodC family protein n=1 Tax=Rhodopseudomonas sp. NSM TaxID=3457630 RepID=UPI004036CE11